MTCGVDKQPHQKLAQNQAQHDEDAPDRHMVDVKSRRQLGREMQRGLYDLARSRCQRGRDLLCQRRACPIKRGERSSRWKFCSMVEREEVVGIWDL